MLFNNKDRISASPNEWNKEIYFNLVKLFEKSAHSG